MTETELFTMLAELPGVSVVNAVRAQGQVKHFTVTFIFSATNHKNHRIIHAVTSLWPFGTVGFEVENSAIRVEFLVRPEEVEGFCRRVAASRLPPSKVAVAVVSMEFGRLPARKVREAVRAALRAGDTVHWYGKRAEVVLLNCQDAELAESRLRQLVQGMGLGQVQVTALKPIKH